eukprot:UN05208
MQSFTNIYNTNHNVQILSLILKPYTKYALTQLIMNFFECSAFFCTSFNKSFSN